MKAILMSIKPKWVAKILNGEKTIEIRKRFSKDYVGWIYIYCTKDSQHPVAPFSFREGWFYREYNDNTHYANGCSSNMGDDINGKVVARFWCDKVEEIKMNLGCNFFTKSLNEEELKKQACLNTTQLEEYLLTKTGSFKCAYAVPISNLEIFDTPKELNEFYGYTDKKVEWYTGLPKVKVITSLKKAPQSRRYIEI